MRRRVLIPVTAIASTKRLIWLHQMASVAGASRERLTSDYIVPLGSLLPSGMLTTMLSPLIGWRVRGSPVSQESTVQGSRRGIVLTVDHSEGDRHEMPDYCVERGEK